MNEIKIPQTYHEESHPYEHDAPPGESVYGPDQKRQLMGTVVLVKKILHKHRNYLSGALKWVVCSLSEDQKRAGWIVGVSHRINGHFRVQAPPEYREWCPEETVPCVLVKYWPTLLPIPIPENGFSPTSATPVSPVRWKWQKWQAHNPEDAREYREWMRERAEKQERDEKGRFI